jgi:hypothetical protein
VREWIDARLASRRPLGHGRRDSLRAFAEHVDPERAIIEEPVLPR